MIKPCLIRSSLPKKQRGKQRNKKTIKMKPKTIDEFCGADAGSFKKFIKQKQSFLQKIEEKRKSRIQAARAAREFSWAVV